MSKSLEWCVEEVGMQLCRRQPELQGANFVHFDSTEKLKDPRIIFKATKKEQQQEGPRAFGCDLEVEYATPKQVGPEQADSVMAGIDRAFGVASLDDPTGIDAVSYFSVLITPEEGGDSSKDNQNQHRTRSRTIPFIAKLAA